jgi:hypothetical protein
MSNRPLSPIAESAADSGSKNDAYVGQVAHSDGAECRQQVDVAARLACRRNSDPSLFLIDKKDLTPKFLCLGCHSDLTFYRLNDVANITQAYLDVKRSIEGHGNQ